MVEHEKTTYYLQVVGATIRASSNKALNTYIRVKIDAFTARTKSVARTPNPSWNEGFTFTARSSSSVRFRAKREAFLFKPLLGEAVVTTTALLELGRARQNVVLKLGAAGSHGDSQDCGEIIVRFWKEEIVKASAVAMADARDVVEDALAHGNSAMKSLDAVVTKLKVLAEVADEVANIHPYVNLVWKATSAVYKIVKDQLDRDQKVIELMSSMEDIYCFVDDIQAAPMKIKRLEDVIRTILLETFQCAVFIQEYAGRGFAKKALKETLSNDATSQIEQFRQRFIQLKSVLDTGTVIQTALVASRMLTKIEVIARRHTLDALQPVTMDTYNRPACLPGTRIDVLEFITNWVTSPSENQSNVLWLHGVAGSGKSTLSTTIANFFQEMHRLGAHIFFSRNFAERNTPSPVIRTLAHQLGSFDHRIGDAISTAVGNAPDIVRSPPEHQFYKLLIEPLASLDVLGCEGPIVVVLDALDECGSARDRSILLNVLAEQSAKLPSILRIIITSRPEYDIRLHFESRCNVMQFSLNIASENTRKDIETYFHHRMAAVATHNKLLGLSQTWPGDLEIQSLTQRACGLFIWASTACQFIDDGHDPNERLGVLLQSDVISGAESALDSLYVTALESASKWEDPSFGADFRAIMGTILVARDPLSPAALNKLLSLDYNRPPIHTISQLGCVLYSNSTIGLLHPSFADFLSNKERCKCDAWFIDVTSHNLRMTHHCLDCLDGYLRRNIFDLNLLTMAGTSLPEHIEYSCCFWIDHLCLIKDASSIAERLERFLFKHLLHWFEAMSILKRSRETVGIMKRLLDWHTITLPDNTRTQELVNDAHRFAQAFGDMIEHHPLQVYASALPFTPVDTILYRTFHDIHKDPWLAAGAQRTWSPLVLTLRNLQQCLFLQFSPDSTRLLSRTVDGYVRIHDAMTGAMLLGPTRAGNCCFSPDGSLVINAWHNDCVWPDEPSFLEVWDSVSGAQIMEPLHVGRQALLNIVIVSPDGALIAYSSVTTLHVWSVVSGSKIFATAARSTGYFITCLAFFPDSTGIVAGSRNGNISAWDCNFGIEKFRPFHAGDAVSGNMQRTGPVVSVFVTSDGTQILSIAGDFTIRVWDARSGTSIRATALQGQCGKAEGGYVAVFVAGGQHLVLSTYGGLIGFWDSSSGAQIRVLTTDNGRGAQFPVTLSPNEKVLASATLNSIRLWDAAATENVSPPRWLTRSSSLALSYSSDGKRIAVVAAEDYSNDSIIFVLDGISGSAMYEPLRGHKGCVAVAFNTDVSRIVSGANDGIRVWDTMLGTQIYAITEGYGDSLSSVSFSADGQQIVSGSRDGRICTWDANSGAALLGPWDTTFANARLVPVRPLHEVVSVAYSPDGTRIVSCSRHRVVFVWDAKSGARVLGPLKNFVCAVDSPSVAAFSPDGTRVGLSAKWRLFEQADAITGFIVEDTKSPRTQFVCKPYDRFVVDYHDKWIKDTTTGQALCCLPIAMLRAEWTASSHRSIAFATESNISVLHFPPWMLSAKTITK